MMETGGILYVLLGAIVYMFSLAPRIYAYLRAPASRAGAKCGLTLIALVCALLWTGAPRADSEAWHAAVRTGDTERLLELAESGVDVNASGPGGKTALMVAASSGDAVLLERLLELGAHVDQRNRGDGTALMYAAQYGQPAAARRLLSAGADPDARGAKGWTPLMIGTLKGRYEILDLLLAHGADPNVPDMFGWTPLMRAVREERSAVARRLLASDRTRVDAVNKSGMTALHVAAALGRLEMAKLLLAHDADPRARDLAGQTPLMLALDGQYEELAELLRGAAAD